jgi:hypothetical protein
MKFTKTILVCLFALLFFAIRTTPAQQVTARISRDGIVSPEGIVLTGKDRLTTPGLFRPPVEITIVAKTDSTNLRMAYAADQVIFNWELNNRELRVDGGPANGKAKADAGEVPRDQYVTIRWVVTPKKQSIYVNKKLRFEHEGDYSQVERPVSVFPAADSKVTVKSIVVKQLPAYVP